MKLIIDVPDEEYKTLSKMSEKEKINELSYYERIIANGTSYNPIGGLISREALKEQFIKAGKDYNYECVIEMLCALETIDNAPTVEAYPFEQVLELVKLNQQFAQEIENLKRAQGEWIPVSERLPESRDWYLGLFKEPETDFIGIPYICDYVGEVIRGTTNEGWILRHCTDVDTVPDYFRNLICVAWRPLPEPYKKGGAE